MFISNRSNLKKSPFSTNTITKMRMNKYSPDQPRDESGRFSGAGSASTVDELNARVMENPKYVDALARSEARGDHRNDPGVIKDGRYTPEADAQNRKIADSMINPNSVVREGQTPDAVFMLGKPGSGKSTLRDSLGLEDRFTIVDADKIMEHLPGYEPDLASAYHERAADIAEHYLMHGLEDQHMNMVLDMTGKNTAKIFKMADDVKSLGYNIHVIHASLSDLDAGKRAYERWQNGGRLVPISYVTGKFRDRPSNTYKLLREYYATTAREYDTSTKKRLAEAITKARGRVGKLGTGAWGWDSPCGRKIPVEKYDPEQARDDHGKWTSGAGDGGTTSRIVFEVAPNPDDKGAVERWNKLTPQEKLDRSELVAREYVPKILAEQGLNGQIQSQTGSYGDSTTASFSLQLPSGTDPNDIVEATKALGYNLSQKEMVALDSKPFPGSEEMGYIHIQQSKDFSLQDAESVYGGIRGIESGGQKAVGGQTTVGNEMLVLNPSAYAVMDTKSLAEEIGKKLGPEYTVSSGTVNAWFASQEKDYGESYSPKTWGSSAGQQTVGKPPGTLRDAITQAVTKAFQWFLKEKFTKAYRQEIIQKIHKFSEDQPRDFHGRWSTGGAGLTQENGFKSWFGQSKVVDSKGNPQVVYHGTKSDFTEFDTQFGGSNTGEPSGRDGFYFSEDPGSAGTFSQFSTQELDTPNIMPVFLKIENPYILERAKGQSTTLHDEMKWGAIDKARENGNEGIIFRGFRDAINSSKKPTDTYFVFKPTQIKSAVGNSGEYNPSNPDITKGSWATRMVLKSAKPNEKFALTLLKVKSDPAKRAALDVHAKYEPLLAKAFINSIHKIKSQIDLKKLALDIEEKTIHEVAKSVVGDHFEKHLSGTFKNILFEGYHAGALLGASQLKKAPVRKGGPGSGPHTGFGHGRSSSEIYNEILSRQRTAEGFKPAVKHLMSGEIHPALRHEATHFDILDRIGGDARDYEQGFVTRRGQFISRNYAENQQGRTLAFKALTASLDVTNPSAVDYLSENLPDLIRQISKDQMAAVQRILLDGVNAGDTGPEIAREIRNVVGLTEAQAQWVANFRDQLESGKVGGYTPVDERRLSASDSSQAANEFYADEINPDRVDELVDAYSTSLLNKRAMDIAITELHDAMIQGQDDLWGQAVDLGYLDPELTRRYWLATDDDRVRDDHAAVPDMNPDGVGLDEPFQTPWGDATNPGDGPPDEAIRCRCTVYLEFLESSDDNVQQPENEEDAPQPEDGDENA